MVIRPIRQMDMTAILRIANASFVDPWTRKDVKDHFKAGGSGLVAEDGRIIGFLLYHAALGKPHQIDSVAVMPDWRRRGAGRALVGEIRKQRTPCSIFIPETEVEAQVFFRAIGFRATEIKLGYYAGGETAYVMENMPTATQAARHTRGN